MAEMGDSYAQNAVAINEFNAPRWQKFVSGTVWGTSSAVLPCTAVCKRREAREVVQRCCMRRALPVDHLRACCGDVHGRAAYSAIT